MFRLKDFDIKTKEYTGGQTGSFKMQHSENKFSYQIKQSILDQKRTRAIKAKFTERENFSELIASISSRALFGDDSAPEVSFVYDDENAKIMIASKYIQGEDVRSLDGFAKQNGVTIAPPNRHVIIVKGEADPTQAQLSIDAEPEASSKDVSTESEKPLESDVGDVSDSKNLLASIKDDLADAIVNSAILGDHDVNPSNMLVITKKDKNRLVRIDFGHALNDLLNAPVSMGGKLINENAMFDFFNRAQVAGIGGADSKLLRDYPGMIPSMELIKSLRRKPIKLSQDNIDIGKNQIYQEFNALINTLEENNNLNAWNLWNVKRSLIEIYQNLTGTTLPQNMDLREVLTETIDKSYEFFVKNWHDRWLVADQMELQIQIDDFNKNNTPIPDEPRGRLGQMGPMQWLRDDQNSPSFFGEVESYLEQKIRIPVSRYEKNETRSVTTSPTASPTASYASNLSDVASTKSTFSFKNMFNNLRNVDFTKENLETDLNNYILKRRTQGRRKMLFGFTRENKCEAASALIRAINDRAPTELERKHYAALKNGELGSIVARHMKIAGVKSIDTLIEAAVESNKTQENDDWSIGSSF